MQYHDLNTLQAIIYEDNQEVGWWDAPDWFDPDPVPPSIAKALWIEARTPTCIALIHSELSEALEGHRKNRMDDHLPHRKNFDVELADALIRILDLAGAHGIDMDAVVAEKLAYNRQRQDHKRAARALENGKKY